MIENHKFDYQYLLKKFGYKQYLGNWIRQYVNMHGFLILQNLETEFSDFQSAKYFFTELSSYIGTLVSHNPGKQDFVWEIKPKISKSVIKTFSEHNQPAPLHTDSQYRNQPEKYMALLVFKQANCGGGYTQLLDFRKVLLELRSNILGKQIVKFFSKEKFPIAVPSVFQEEKGVNYIYSRLISNVPLVRYRYDTLKTGLSLINHSYVESFYENLDILNNFLQNSPFCSSFLLLNNEVIFVDNHRFLHGRTAFIDTDRLLFRIRIN